MIRHLNGLSLDESGSQNALKHPNILFENEQVVIQDIYESRTTKGGGKKGLGVISDQSTFMSWEPTFPEI